MAKFQRAAAPRVMVIQAPKAKRRSGGVRRAARRAGGAAKRAGGALAKKAWEEKLAGGAVIGAGVVGYAEGAGMLDMVPDFGLGRVPTLAAIAYFGGDFMGSRRVKQAGIGLAAAAAFAFGQDQGRKRK